MKKLIGLVLGWLASGSLGSAAQQTVNLVYTNAADIHKLSREESAAGKPVRLRGVVTYSDYGWSVLFVQDQSSGIFVSLSSGAFPTNGEVIEVSGTTTDGGFLPIVTQATWQHLGASARPEPKQLGPTAQVTGDLDCEWAELVGVVRDASLNPEQDHLQLEVAGRGWRTQAFVPLQKGSDLKPWQRLVNTTVRMTGVCGVDYDDVPGKFRLKTFVPGVENIQGAGEAPNEPFKSPLLSLKTVRGLAITNLPMHQVRVRGVVTYASKNGELVIQEGDSALRVNTTTNSVKRGSCVEMAGFLTPGPFGVVLEKGLVREVPAKLMAEPVEAIPGAILWGDFDGRLVRIPGVVQSQRYALGIRTLMLIQDGIPFGVTLDSSDSETSWSEFKPGDRVQATGVCVVQVSPKGAAQSFGLRVSFVSGSIPGN